MSQLQIKSAESCHYDEISMGEVMLRLDPAKAASAPRAPSEPGKGEENITSRGDSAAVSVCARAC